MLTLGLWVFCAYSAEENISCAIEVLDTQGVNRNTAIIITDRLINELSSIPRFTCMDRRKMEEMLPKNDPLNADCRTDECCLNKGRLLGVSYICKGSVTAIGKLTSLHLVALEVQSGKTVSSVNKDCDVPVETIVSTVLKPVAAQLAQAILSLQYAKLNITSNPPGAAVFVNNKRSGVTPIKNGKILSGSYRIRVELNTYNPVEREIDIQRGASEFLTFDLSHPQAYLDSVAAVRKAREAAIQARAKKKRNMLLVGRIGIGVLAAGFGGYGYYLDRKIGSNMDKKRQLYQQYKTSTTFQQFESYRADYDIAHKRGEELTLRRNACYVAAGIAGVGFLVTFAF